MSPENEELAPRDDAAIGRAFRRSLVLLLLVGGVFGGVAFLVEPTPPRPNQPGGSDASPSSEARVNAIPAARFTDITAASGIAFVHNNGAYGDKLLPETMGGGVAFFDYDNNGGQDLLFINSTWW